MTVDDAPKDEVTVQREKQEKKAKSVLTLRQELRNGRTRKATDGSGEDTGGISGTSDTKVGTTLQAPGRASKRLTPTGGAIDSGRRGNRDNGRSVAAESLGERSGDREPGESHSGPIGHSETDERSGGQRAIGRLETDEPIHLRPDEPPATFEGQTNRPVLVPAQGTKEDYYPFKVFGVLKGYSRRDNKKQHISVEQWEALPNQGSQQSDTPAIAKGGITSTVKEAISGGTLPWFQQGNVLSAREAQELSGPLMAAIQDDLHYLDELLWLRYPHGAGRDIWGNLDDDEAGVLTRMLLKRAQQSPAAASTVRAIVDSKDYIATAEIVAPRVVKTYRLVKTAPERPRKQFSLFRKVE